jgi:hypothetical protein
LDRNGGGNKLFNSVWEGKIAFDTPRPPAVLAQEFINRKYVLKVYFQSSALKSITRSKNSGSINFLKASASDTTQKISSRRLSMSATITTTATATATSNNNNNNNDPFGGGGAFGGDGFLDGGDFTGDFDFGGDDDDTWWEPTAGDNDNDPFGGSPKPSSSRSKGPPSSRHPPSRSKSTQEGGLGGGGGGGGGRPRSGGAISRLTGGSQHSKDTMDSAEKPRSSRRLQRHSSMGGHSQPPGGDTPPPIRKQGELILGGGGSMNGGGDSTDDGHSVSSGRRRVGRRGSVGYSQPPGGDTPPPMRKQGELILGGGSSMNGGGDSTDDGHSVSSGRRRVGRRGSVGRPSSNARKLTSGSNHSTSLDSIDDEEDQDLGYGDGEPEPDTHGGGDKPRRRPGRRAPTRTKSADDGLEVHDSGMDSMGYGDGAPDSDQQRPARRRTGRRGSVDTRNNSNSKDENHADDADIPGRRAPTRTKSVDDVLEVHDSGMDSLGYGDGAPDSDQHRPARRRTGRRGSVDTRNNSNSKDENHADDADMEKLGSRRNIGDKPRIQRTRSGVVSSRKISSSRKLGGGGSEKAPTSSRKLGMDTDTATTEGSDSSDHSPGNDVAAKPKSTKILASLYGKS